MEQCWFTWLVYIISMITLWMVFWTEYGELFNEGKSGSDINNYKYNRGASYYEGKYRKNQSYDRILRNIRISARYDVETVYWRRSLIFSIIVSFLILLLVLRRLPMGTEFLSAIIVLYLSLYFFLIYYQRHVSFPAVKQVCENLEWLQKRSLSE